MYTADQICSMIEFLADNIFVKLKGSLFRQVIGIPMGRNCTPLLADLFLYSYESEFLDNLVRSGHRRLARSFATVAVQVAVQGSVAVHVMAEGHVFHSGNFPRCDKCKIEGSTTGFRPYDEMQCDRCWYEKDDEHEQYQEISSVGPDDGSDVETPSQNEASKTTMSLIPSSQLIDVNAEGNETHNGSFPEQMLQSSQHKLSIVIKNSNETAKNCVKCKKKLIDGLSYSQCEKGLHWRCGGVSKDEIEDEIITQNYWNCIYCCPSCSLKEKEIKELKLSCVKLQKSIKKLKHELKTCSEKYTDAEDQLTRERKLRKRTEDELMELQEMHE